MIELDALSSLHLVLESAQSLSHFSAGWAEMSLASWSILRVSLFPNWGPCVISLVSIRLFSFIIGPASFGQGPSWEVLFGGGVGASFWHIPARADSIRSAGLVLEGSCASSSEAKSVCWLLDNFWSLFGVVLWAWCLLEAVYLHPWLSSYFGCECGRFSAQVSCERVVKESSVFIKVILWLISSLTFSSSEWPTRWLLELDFICVSVHWSWWHLACIVKLRQLAHVNFVPIVSFCLGESKQGVWLLNWQRQFTKRSTSLLWIQCLC